MNAKDIVKKPTCNKSLSDPSCVDLIITSSSNFENMKTISKGLSDFRKMVITVLKQAFQRSSPKELVYRDYKNFNRFIFKKEREGKYSEQISLEILNIHVTIKRKLFVANHALCMIKALGKTIMKRSELEKEYVKIRHLNS